MEVSTLVWILVAIALLIIGVIFVTGSWDIIYDLFDKAKWMRVLG